MCYHKLYLFLNCGHSCPSPLPVRYSRCPLFSPLDFDEPNPSFKEPITSPRIDSVPDFPITPLEPAFEAWERRQSEAEIKEARRKNPPKHTYKRDGYIRGNLCGQIFTHPLHTYKIQGICSRCRKRREGRLRRFEEGILNSFALDTQDRIRRREIDWMRWFDGKEQRVEKRQPDKQRPTLAKIKLLQPAGHTDSERAVFRDDPWASQMSLGSIKLANIAVATKPKVVEKKAGSGRGSTVVDSVLHENVDDPWGRRVRKSRNIVGSIGTAPGGADWI